MLTSNTTTIGSDPEWVEPTSRVRDDKLAALTKLAEELQAEIERLRAVLAELNR